MVESSYKPLGYHKIGNTGDRVELYGISRDDILGASDPLPNPSCIERSRPQLKTYIEQANGIVEVVFGHLEKHLKLPQGTFSKLQPMTKPSGSVLRMLKYEPQVSCMLLLIVVLPPVPTFYRAVLNRISSLEAPLVTLEMLVPITRLILQSNYIFLNRANND